MISRDVRTLHVYPVADPVVPVSYNHAVSCSASPSLRPTIRDRHAPLWPVNLDPRLLLRSERAQIVLQHRRARDDARHAIGHLGCIVPDDLLGLVDSPP